MGYKTADPTDIPEVAAYMEAEEMLRLFLEARPDFAKTLREMIHDLDQKRQAADKVVKARGVVCGPWKVHSVRTTYNADLLYDLIGKEQFLAVGGVEETVVQKTVDKKKLEAAIAKGELQADTIAEIKKESLAYKAPKGFEF